MTQIVVKFPKSVRFVLRWTKPAIISSPLSFLFPQSAAIAENLFFVDDVSKRILFLSLHQFSLIDRKISLYEFKMIQNTATSQDII
jgi:hypothetical protein